ncbi:MAG: hypothetical protein GY801_46485 [bacterium]|nr:hypothetical protein [bacterium]
MAQKLDRLYDMMQLGVRIMKLEKPDFAVIKGEVLTITLHQTQTRAAW